jgi:cbb3-type cytochrome oxidase maturation protein
MNIFYLLIGVSLLGALIFLALFIWAVRHKQFDDDKTPPIRMLFDDDSETDETNQKNNNQLKD